MFTRTDDELNDSLDDLLGGSISTATRPAPRPIPEGFVPQRLWSEPCAKCGGTGSWRGRGQCFACKGAGKHTFKTSPESRARARVRTEVKAVERKIEQAAWREQHKVELAWLNKAVERQWTLAHQGKPGWDFPGSLNDSLERFGTLTDGQIAAIRKCIARDEQRKVEREAAKADIDISRIEAAFAHARAAAAGDGEGIKWLKLRLADFQFSPAGANSRNPGAIYVKRDDEYLGKVQGGKFSRAFACDAATEARIIEVAADPAAAAKAYGLRTGQCSCCGRELTNRQSIDAGIGPICAEKYGWAV